MVRRRGRERVVLQGRGVEDANLARAQGSHVERRAVAGDGHALREREAPLVLRAGQGSTAGCVIDVLVQVPWGHPARTQHRDPALVQVSPQRLAREDPRALEPLVVLRVGVGDIDLPVHRVDDHVVENGADAGIKPRRTCPLYRRIGQGVDDEDVLVGQREAHLVVPGAADVIDPVGAVVLDEDAALGLR